MCWVMTSTKFAVVQWESSVGGSPRTATLSTPPFFGVCAWASSPATTMRPTTSSRASSGDRPDRNPRIMENLPRAQAWASKRSRPCPGRAHVPSALYGGVSAIDEQVAPRHESRRIARKVDGGAGDLLGQTEAIEQMLWPHHPARLV